MNFFKTSSLSVGLAVLSVLCGGLSAQAEAVSTTSDVATPAAAPATPAIASAQTETSAIAPSEVTATTTTVPSVALDTLTAQQQLASHTPSHTTATPTDSAATTTPEPIATDAAVTPTSEPDVTIAETTNFAPTSTAAADLTPAAEPTNSTAEVAPTNAEQPQVAQVPTSPVFRRPPGNNYIGAGVNFGDDTSFAVLSKFTITQFSTYGVSLRPAVLFGDSVDFRVPITIGTLLNTDSETANRFAPYAGLGVAVNTEDDDDDDDDTTVDFMLTAGSDFLITDRFTANANLNLIFTDDTDLEFMLGVGYNF